MGDVKHFHYCNSPALTWNDTPPRVSVKLTTPHDRAPHKSIGFGSTGARLGSSPICSICRKPSRQHGVKEKIMHRPPTYPHLKALYVLPHRTLSCPFSVCSFPHGCYRHTVPNSAYRFDRRNPRGIPQSWTLRDPTKRSSARKIVATNRSQG